MTCQLVVRFRVSLVLLLSLFLLMPVKSALAENSGQYFANIASQSFGGKPMFKKNDGRKDLALRSDRKKTQDSKKSKPSTIEDKILAEKDKGFFDAVNDSKAFPLSSDQIKLLHQMKNKYSKDVNTSPNTPPNPANISRIVHLDPGAPSPIIRVKKGYVSVIMFLDKTGQPWPMTSYDVGNSDAFSVLNGEEENNYLLFIQPSALYKSGNLVVTLKGLATPVMITLMAGTEALDYRVDLRVDGIGPNAKYMLGESMDVNSQALLPLLDGVQPMNSQVMDVSGVPHDEVQAWAMGSDLFIRSHLDLISPSWTSMVSGPDGTHVYKLYKAPVLLMSYNGRVVHVKLS